MRLLVTGDRDWSNVELLNSTLDLLHILYRIDILIEGEARGADKLSRIHGEKLGIKVLRYYADWRNLGLKAGVIRNTRMLEEGRPDFAVAFHHDLSKSRGTKDMVLKCIYANIKVLHILSENERR